MKQMRINHQTLAASVPPPTETFAADTMARLAALAAEEERPMKRKISSRAIWIAALLIVLLAATALAIGLTRTAEADAVVQARQALMDDYGLTNETIGCFNYRIDQDGGSWTITFDAAAWHLEQLGTYTVTLANGQSPQTSWTHDDVDPALWQGSDDLSAPAWGQEQILRRLKAQGEELDAINEADKEQYWASYDPDAESMPLNYEGSNHLRAGSMERIDLDEGELSSEEVLRIAREAILETYGAGEDVLYGYEGTVYLGRDYMDKSHQYVVKYTAKEASGTFNTFNTLIASPSGEILDCYWKVDAAQNTLPDGPLDAHVQAAEEFAVSGALKTRPEAEQADIVQRMQAAGFGAFLAGYVDAAKAGAEDIPVEDAVSAAKQALMDTYQISEDGLSLFRMTTLLLETDSARTWEIRFIPDWAVSQSDWQWLEIGIHMGTYAISVDAATGDVLRTIWSMQDRWTGDAYTESTWGSSRIVHGSMLDWAIALHGRVEAIFAKYPADDAYPDGPSIYDLTLEDGALYDQTFREAGFSTQQYHRALPGEGDLSYEEAWAIAREAILAEMPHVEKMLDGAYVDGNYSLYSPEGPTWRFGCQFMDTDTDVYIDFGVAMDARTGEILLTNIITGGNG